MGLEKLVQSAKRFGRDAVVAGMIVASGVLSQGCRGDKVNGPENSNKYLYFGVGAKDYSRERIPFGVRVYNQDTREKQDTRKIWPSNRTLPIGDFYVTDKLDASREYRIEIYDGEIKSCYKTLGGISQESTPNFWTDYDFSKAQKIAPATTPLPPEPPRWSMIYLDSTLTPIQGCFGGQLNGT